MQSPHLLDGLKYDLRLYVLVMCCDPLKIYLYNEGMVRFATQPYKPIEQNADKAELNNMFVHLTNYAVNKESKDFRMAEELHDEKSHKRSITKVLEQLKAVGMDPDKIMGEVKDVIIKTLISV